MIRNPLIIMFAVAGLLFGGCTRSTAIENSRPTVTVSIEPQRWFLERIVGDRMEINTLMARGGNPESYEPTFADLSKLESGALFIGVGHLPFETSIIEKVKANHPDLRIMECSESIDLITDNHGHGHDHGIDPHTWSSAANAKIIASNMLKAVKDIDPAGADAYDVNYLRLIATIDSVDSLCREILEPVENRTFIVWHPSLSYFARDYGLQQFSVGTEGKEHSVRDTRDILNHIKDYRAQVFLVQKDFDVSRADVIAQSGENMRVETINPLNYEWDRELVATARAIAGQ